MINKYFVRAHVARYCTWSYLILTTDCWERGETRLCWFLGCKQYVISCLVVNPFSHE